MSSAYLALLGGSSWCAALWRLLGAVSFHREHHHQHRDRAEQRQEYRRTGPESKKLI